MAQPSMCSATTTGPETEKILPCSFCEAMVEEGAVEGGEMGVIELDEAGEGESGSGGSGSSGGGG